MVRLHLSHGKLRLHPRQLQSLDRVTSVELKGNNLTDVPAELMLSLKNVKEVNLGNNSLTELPACLACLSRLTHIHLFSNGLRELNARCVLAWTSLTCLNVNRNHLRSLPPEIGQLVNLRVLSAAYNHLVRLPQELCLLNKLQELYLRHNRLEALPLEIGLLSALVVLQLQQNCLRELPESLCRLYHLRQLDIAANQLRVFPTKMQNLPLKELHFEENPLLEFLPISSVQEEEVLSLKEAAARAAMRSLRRSRESYVRRALPRYPAAKELLAQCTQCAVCDESFLNTWLECVKFVAFNHKRIPIRALLCSYKCFNRDDHSYYGVAFVDPV